MRKIIVLTFMWLLPVAILFGQPGENIYRTYCAGCHGNQLQGNSASKLIKTDWQYGRGKGAIVRNIRFGIPGTEMVAWGTALKAEQINAVADYIVAAQEVAPNAIRPIPERLTTKDYVLKVETLVSEGLNTPWGIEFVDSRRALITERTGSIRWMIDGKLDPQPVAGVPMTYSQQTTGGLMDIALDPDYAKNGWVYIGFSHTLDNPADKAARGMTKVVRGKIRDHKWVNEQTLFEAPDSLKISGGNRWGCRFLFDKKGYLYFTIGDMARGSIPRIPENPAAKFFAFIRMGPSRKTIPTGIRRACFPRSTLSETAMFRASRSIR